MIHLSRETLMRGSIAAVMAFGVVLAVSTFAGSATPVGTVEGESMTLTPPSAGQAAGSSLAMRSNSTATAPVNLTAPAGSLIVTAKGDYCRGNASFTVKVDGVQVGTGSAGSSWSNHTFSRSLPAGNHTVAVTFTNDYAKTQGANPCNRNLYIDKTVFYGQSAPAPSPSPTQTAVTSPAAGSIYWGAWMDGDVYGSGGDAPWTVATWDRFEQDAGKKVSIVHFGQPAPWNQSFAPDPLNKSYARGAIPMMDMDPDGASLTSIVNGSRDASLIAWARAAKAYNRPFFFRWSWEMNGQWFSYGKEAAVNPSLYTEAWKRFHTITVNEGATNVTWIWCPNTVFSGSTALKSLYPGDAYVDWTCIDGYNRPDDTWKSFTQVFKTTYDQVVGIAPSKPVMIGETASTELNAPAGQSKATWTANALGTEIPNGFPKIKALVWFNWNVPHEGGRDWPIESSTAAQSAFSSAIKNSRYSTNTFGGLTGLKKVLPLP